MHVRLASVLAIVLLIAAACSASTELVLDDENVSPQIDAVDDDGSSDIPPAELTSQAVFELIEDSVVFVESPDELSSGSGFMIEEGWILTNAHVVGRHDTMRIGRSDGEQLGSFPVHAVDWIYDLALVGPIDDPALSPISPATSRELSIGSRVLLAGFPDEGAISPTPSLTEGIVSRSRVSQLGGYSFVQVDATIAAGQSGGPLVNGWGELVGISGIEFGEGEFGVALAADALGPRVDAMIEAGPEPLVSGPAEFELSAIGGPLRNFGFLVEVEEGSSLDMTVASAQDIWVAVQTLGGVTVSRGEQADFFRLRANGDLYVDEQRAGGEDIIANVEPGMYQVLIGAFTGGLSAIEVSSNSPMWQFADAEEGQTLPIGEIVEGGFDWVRDTDQWELPLEAGQEVVVTAGGYADTVMTVRLGDVVVGSSDDAGLGPFGYGSQVEFTATEAGTYTIEIGTFDQTRWGYLLEATVN